MKTQKEFEFEKYSKTFGLNDMLNISKTKFVFTDPQLEKDYLDSRVMNMRNKKFFIDLLAFLIILFRVLNSVSELPVEKNKYFYSELSLVLAGLFLLFLVHIFIKNIRMIKFFHKFLSYFILFINVYNTVTIHSGLKYNNLENLNVRSLYILILTSFVLPLFFYDYNMHKLIFFYTITTACLTYIAIIEYTAQNRAYIEVVCFNILFLFLPFYSWEKSLVERREYLKNYQLNKIFEFFSDIVNNMNGMLLSVRKGLICVNNNQMFLQMAQSNKLLNPFTDKNREGFNSEHRISILDKESMKKEVEQEQELEDKKYKIKDNKSYRKTHTEKIPKKEIDQNNSFAYLKGIFSTGNMDSFVIPDLKLLKESSCHEELNFIQEKNLLDKSSKNNFNREDRDNRDNTHNNRDNNFTINKEIYIELNDNEIYSISLNKLRIDKISEKYASLNPEADNFLDIIKALSANSANITDAELKHETEFLDQKNSFSYLGEFFLQQEKKLNLQVFFRRNCLCKDTLDFLLYDISKIREAEEIEFKLRSQFFANIAHEFKTPLNSIIGLIKLMQNNAANGMDSKDLNASLAQIGNLSHYVIFLITDIIEYSNINSNINIEEPKQLNNENNINFLNNNGFTLFDSKRSLINPKNANLKKFNLKINLVNLKEITYFCADIANSLILNKSKEKHVSVIFSFDEKINELEVLTDEKADSA